ncbi:hypothetical protein [Parasitella parasitica]|uniref:E3 ubiquitin-protein ligase listerin n=1 Tax=Parasitella parasitica TaxID=35722 RepID=A0A0B7NU02_9FUNG|nr:hypothetical protein [Parasitella parasitica]
MGRPTKPRVKGNMQPASSSRAAELTGPSHTLSFENLGGFAQFAGTSTTPGIMSSRPSTPSSDAFETAPSAELDPELIVILKKVSKRDTVTKLKALEELEAYLQLDINAVGHILHNWVAVYSKLVLEVDRRVRLVANQVHALITANAKKKLAPLLKEFVGPWLLSMNDQSKDIAKTAQNAFEAVFAVEKRLGAISFCQKEILDYVTDMLLYKTAETLSDARYVSKEDMLSKYARVVASCLQVVSYLITVLSIEERSKRQKEYDIILDDTTMWKKFATHSNPVIRKALYAFLKTLLLSWIDVVEPRLELICSHFFASVFVEKDTTTHSDMWDALLLMTKKMPLSWVIIGKKKPALPKLYNFLRNGLNGSASIAYPSMLALLANLPDELKKTPKFYTDVFDNFWKGLSSGYIDKSNFHIFLNAYAECIVYFAITLSKSNDEESVKSASTLIESTFWDMIKIYFLNSRDNKINDKLDANSYAIIAKHLAVLASVDNTNKDFLKTFWANLDEMLVQTVVDCGSVVTRAPLDMDVFCQKTGGLLAAISSEIDTAEDSKYDSLKSFTKDLAKRLLLASVESSLVHKEKSFGLLILANRLINTYSVTDVKGLAYATEQLLDLLVDGTENVCASLASYYITFATKVEDKAGSVKLWNALMNKLNDMFNKDGLELRSANTLILVLEQIHAEDITLDVTYRCDALDNIVSACTLVKLNEVAIIVPRSVLESLISSTLRHHLAFGILSDSCATIIFKTLESNLYEFNRHQYIDKSTRALPELAVQVLKTTLSTLIILQKIASKKDYAIALTEISGNIVCEVFDAMFVTVKTPLEEEEQVKAEDDEELSLQISQQASSVWDHLASFVLANEAALQSTLLEHVKQSITDIHYSASPSDSVSRIKKIFSTVPSCVSMSAILGTEQDWKTLSSVPMGQNTTEYLSLGLVDIYASLSVQPLVDDLGELRPVTYDIYGLTSFARFALFLGEYLLDAQTRREFFDNGNHDWVIRQLMIVCIACEQGILVPDVYRLWESKAIGGIHVFVQSANQVLNEWLAEIILEVGDMSFWSNALIQYIHGNTTKNQGRLISFIAQLASHQDSHNPALSAQLLQRVLQRLVILRDWKPEDAEKWIPLIKAESDQLGLLSKVAILISFKGILDNTESFKHYQSDLSSKLSGVTSQEQLDFDLEDPDLRKKKNWSLLALLNASSPKRGSFDLPRQRLMYLIQGIRPLLNDEDSDFSSDQQKARIHAQLAQLLKHLSESVQDVFGSHWELFLQCCFSWMTLADTALPEELLVVYHALELFKTLWLLSEEAGKDELHAAVQSLMPAISKSLLQLMANEEKYLQQQKKDQKNQARLVYQTLLSDLLEHIPEKTLVESEYFANLNRLVRAPNEVLQKRAYLLLKKYIAYRVQDLSVRLEFTETSEEKTQTDIDATVFDVILNPPDLSEWQSVGIEEHNAHEALGYLLTWMLMFDHFTDIVSVTFKLKQEYTAQLKDQEAVSHLMPVLCKVLSIGQQQGSKPFDLAPWSIVEYDPSGFDLTSEMSFLVLASHLYYRALTHIPSLVRLWWIDCKHRQLTIAVEAYTEKYFSQQLINSEMDLVNRPDIKTQLEENDDNEFTVKTLRAAGEVTATYRVDEQNMQIAIKMPSNFPLRQIDVEGIQKVGVNDKQWRGWMFAVAAVIGSQNGNIVDALTVFKRNIYTHETM